MSKFLKRTSSLAEAIRKSKDFKDKGSDQLKAFCSTADGKVQQFQKLSNEVEAMEKELREKKRQHLEAIKEFNEVTEALHLLTVVEDIKYTPIN